MIDRQMLRAGADGYGIALTDSQLAQFDRYADMLVEWNGKFNLTAITDPTDICVKHFLDSLMLLTVLEIPGGASLVDVGTGAGFPGVPLKIVRPDLKLTLLDSLGKRIGFLRELSADLGQQNLCIHGRAEELARREELRESFDLATARAVAGMPVLSEYCVPFVKVGGFFAAYKGSGVDSEIETAGEALRKLGAKVDTVSNLNLPGDNRRSIILIKKISQTPTKYPRNYGKIVKNPL